MYGQLYHRTISRELPEPQRDPRGRVRRGGWRGADGSRRLHGCAGARLGLGLGWRGVGGTRAAGRARSALTPTAMGGAAEGWARWTRCGRRSATRVRRRRWTRAAGPQATAGTSEMAGGRMRQAGQARAAGRKARPAGPRAACRYRMAQSPFGRTAGRCRGKAGRHWQHLRAMRDFGLLDAKRGPWRQDSRAMYPESPDCARKWMHREKMLPS